MKTNSGMLIWLRRLFPGWLPVLLVLGVILMPNVFIFLFGISIFLIVAILLGGIAVFWYWRYKITKVQETLARARQQQDPTTVDCEEYYVIRDRDQE